MMYSIKADGLIRVIRQLSEPSLKFQESPTKAAVYGSLAS